MKNQEIAAKQAAIKAAIKEVIEFVKTHPKVRTAFQVDDRIVVDLEEERVDGGVTKGMICDNCGCDEFVNGNMCRNCTKLHITV